MSKVHEVQWRLLWQRLLTLFRQAQEQNDQTIPDGVLPAGNAELLLRLTGAAMTLLERHTTDTQGRCRVRGCARPQWALWRPRRCCRVFLTVQFWMEQRLDIAEKAAQEW